MRPFTYERANDAREAVKLAGHTGAFLAGGTTLLDLMKLDVMRPATLVDINGAAKLDGVSVDSTGLTLGALVRMSTVADNAQVQRDYPVIAQSLALAASAQIRNMASLGGNVLQRTRCEYFRDTREKHCNKREPGSGCAALDGCNRGHAVLGTSDACIATFPGDWAVALIALGANIEITGPSGTHTIPFAKLHAQPGATPHIETVLKPGELITRFTVPAGAYTKRSLYLKIRDRASYQFALASAAVALDVRDGVVKEARIGLGGVATVPWRAREAEAALSGKKLDEASARNAADAAFAQAKPRGENTYKVELGKRTLTRALLAARDLGA